MFITLQQWEVVVFSRVDHFGDTAVLRSLMFLDISPTNSWVHRATRECSVNTLVCCWYPSWGEQAPISALPAKLNVFLQVLKV